MMSFFFLLIVGVLFLMQSCSNTKGKWQHQAFEDAQEIKNREWKSRICKGDEGGIVFNEALIYDRDFVNSMISECNSILDSIPEMNGAQLFGDYGDNRFRAMNNIIRCVYYAKFGVVPGLWCLGYIHRSEIADGLSIKPTEAGMTAFFKWYESELRKNGFSDAKISVVRVGPNRLDKYWYFENCPYVEAFVYN